MLRSCLRAGLAAIVLLTISGPGLAAEFGAIAYSPRTGETGYAISPLSLPLARSTAMRRCGDRAGDCRIVVWTRNGCAAVAHGSRGRFGYAYAKDKSDARRLALVECGKRSPACVPARAMCISSLY